MAKNTKPSTPNPEKKKPEPSKSATAADDTHLEP